MKFLHYCCALAAVALGLSATDVGAQQEFAVDRYEPAERGSDWFAGESLDLRGNLRPAIGVTFDWAHEPLAFYDEDGNEIAHVVKAQKYLHLGGALIFADRLRLGVNMPFLVRNRAGFSERAGAALSSESGTAIGDLRVGADLRLLGEYGDVATLAIGGQLHVPTGDQTAFASDGKVRIRPRVMLAGDIGAFAYAASMGMNFRHRDEDLANAEFGNELTFVASAGVRLVDRKLLIGAEVYGSSVVSDNGDGFLEDQSTAVEAMPMAKYAIIDSLRVGAGWGPGLTDGFGSPKWRFLATVEWFSPYEEPAEDPSDRDGDGIYDEDDACPDTPGVASDDPDEHGCPEKAPPPPEPEPDTDGDGILDKDDACVHAPGVANDDPEKHGCPAPLDRDDDGILDEDDACPDEAGPSNEDRSKHGCPKVQIADGQIKILERVEFDTAKATIRPESDEILSAVLKVLEEHAEILEVNVEGHTDNRGSEAFNKGLSQRRAAAVVSWLVQRGIDRGRLTSAGFGPSRPMDDNSTEEGRQNNRRVEFHITEKKE